MTNKEIQPNHHRNVHNQKNPVISAHYEGPIPPSAEMKRYAEIDANLPQRIMAMAEAQSRHRQEMENKKVEHEYELEKKRLHDLASHWKRRDCEAKLGQIFAFLLVLTILGGAFYAISLGHPVTAAFMSALGLGTVVSVFIRGRTQDNK